MEYFSEGNNIVKEHAIQVLLKAHSDLRQVSFFKPLTFHKVTCGAWVRIWSGYQF